MKFSRIFTFAIILISGFVFSACLNIEEKLSLNADGSGVLVSTIDMGAMLSNPLVMMSMQEEMKKNGDAVPERIDSALNLIEPMIELNPQWTADDLKLLNKIESRMVMDMEAGEGAVTVTIPFQNLDELVKVQKLMIEAKKPETEGEEENPFSGLAGGNTINSFVWKKGKLSRSTVINNSKGMLDALAGDDESIGMMKMMFSDAKMSFIMEMPGKIKKVKGFEGATVEGNVLTQEFDFLELLDNVEQIDAALDGQIKYQK